MERLRYWHPLYETVVGLASYVLNLTVIYLALKRTGEHMKKYSVIIILNAVVDLIFNTANMIVKETVDMEEGRLFMVNFGLTENLPQPYAAMVSMTWLFFSLLVVVTVPIQFLYRYSILCRNTPLKLWQFVVTYAAFIMGTAIHCALGMLVFEIDPKVLDKYRPLLQKNPMYAKNTPMFIVGESRNLSMSLHLLECQLVVGGAYVVITFCTYKTLKKLRELRSSMSPKTYEAQKQMTKIMGIQAIYPIVLVGVPAAIAGLGPIFNLTVPLLGPLLTAAVSLMPVANSLAVILIIPSFRRALVGRNVSITTSNTKEPLPFATTEGNFSVL